jgi:Fe-S-cluster-containing dehydrogenase component
MDRCIECGSCAAACFVSHGNMPAVGFARTGPALLPVLCRQCKDAACVAACPAEAMVQDEKGVVRRMLARCVGCGSCARACPFGVLPATTSGEPIGWNPLDRVSGHQIAKCDLCEDRLSEHRDAIPRCVSACPSGALRFADERQAEELGLLVLGGRTTGDDPYKRR